MNDLLKLLGILAKTDLSFLLIAPPGHGKTTMILRTMPPGSLEMNDFTACSLRAALQIRPKVKRIVCSDFNLPMSHKSSVANLLTSEMLPLMAEGTKNLGAGNQVT